MIISYFKLLIRKNFFLLWLGQIISQFGDRLTQVALVGLITKASTSSTKLALAMSLTIIPVFIISPISGVYVDRWSKRKTMYISDLLRAICIVLIPIFFWKFQSLTPVYILIFLSFSVGRFFIPAKMSFIPLIAKQKDIFLANSLISITATIAAIFGIGLGGIIVEKYGLISAFSFDATTFLFSAIAIFLISTREKGIFVPKDILNIGKDVVASVKKSFVYELKEGIKYIFESKETKYAFKVFLFLFSYIGGLYVVFIRFIQEVLVSITKDLGFTAVALGIGMFIGSLVYGRIAHKFSVRKIINFTTTLSAAYIIFFAASLKAHPQTYYAIILAFILGVIISPIFVGVNALIHRESDKKILGRIFSGLEFISHLGFLVSMFICSILADIFTNFTIIVSIGIIAFLVSLLFSIKND